MTVNFAMWLLWVLGFELFFFLLLLFEIAVHADLCYLWHLVTILVLEWKMIQWLTVDAVHDF